MEELYNLKVKEIMTPVDATPFMEEKATCGEFLTKLSLRAHAWVVNNIEDMKVVGIVTEHNMLRHLAHPRDRKERVVGLPRSEVLQRQSIVQDIMTRNPVVCSPEETVADALKKSPTFNIRPLAVVDENRRLLGEVTIQLLVRSVRQRFRSTE